MKKIVRWFSGIISLEIALVFSIYWKSTYSTISNQSLFPFLMIPILLLWVFFIAFFFLTLINTEQSNAVLTGVFEKNKTVLVFFFLINLILIIGSAVFFITADLYEKEIYSGLQPFAILGYVLFWEVIVLFAYTRDEFREKPKYWIGLPFILAGNYFLRHTLERSGVYLEPYFSKVFSNRADKVFTTYKWWQLMLPIREFSGYWFFGNILTHFMQAVIGIAGVWYLDQAILIVTAFFLSWKVFRSKVMSYFLVICLGFGTHFYNAYQYSSVASLYLLQSLIIVLLFLSYQYIRNEKKNQKYLFMLIPTLVLTAIFYEGWLDFFASVWAISIFLIFYLKYQKQDQYIKRVLIIFLVFNLIAAIYVYIKFTYIHFAHASGESAVVFTYESTYFWRAVEDVTSNYITDLYITLTNFLPPGLITSNALYHYTDVLEQRNSLILGHYIFLWRYAAGALAAIFFMLLFKVNKKVFTERPFSPLFPLALFMLMVAINSPTHAIILIRIPKTMPLLGYKVQQGILGFSLCIAYAFHLFDQKTKNKKWVTAVFVTALLIILYSSLRRPNYLWHMMEMVGIDHQGPFPNPFFMVVKYIREILPGFLRY